MHVVAQLLAQVIGARPNVRRVQAVDYPTILHSDAVGATPFFVLVALQGEVFKFYADIGFARQQALCTNNCYAVVVGKLNVLRNLLLPDVDVSNLDRHCNLDAVRFVSWNFRQQG